ncbi:MAG: Ig-like domain-containing protein, partial [Pseudomonadota bacterium]
MVSDDFADGTLAPVWLIDGPAGIASGVSTSQTDGYLELVTPDGDYDVWFANNGARALQTVSDNDFALETRFLTTPSERYQLQGILVEQDADNWLRFDTYSDGNTLYAFSAITVNGTSTPVFQVAIPQGTAPYLRVDRTGDTWTYDYSQDGQVWTTAGTVSHALTAIRAGVFAGNVGDTDGYTAQVDYVDFNNTLVDEDAGITPQNVAPIALNDALSTGIDSELTIATASLLANDSDANGDALLITDVTDPDNGTLTDNGDGTLTYSPDLGYSGTDNFSYMVSDGDLTDTATVTVTVTDGPSGPTPVFDQPGAVAFNGTPGSVIELPHAAVYEVPAGTVSFAFTAADTNGAQGLFVKDASGYVGGGNHFALYLDGSTLVARFQDAGAQDIVQVPGIIAGQTYDVAMTFDGTGGAIWLDGAQVASTALVMDWTENTQVIQWGGRGWGSGDGQTGFDAPFEGTMSDRQVFDSALDAAQIAALHADGPPNADPIAADDTITVDEDGSASIDPTLNDSDPDGDSLTVGAIVTGAANGTAEIIGNDVTYTPDANYFGADSFDVEVRDGRGGTAVSTVDVTVTPVEDDPVATDDSATALPETATVIDVLANDSDGDGDPLTVTLETPAANGTVTRNADNTFTYTPDPGFAGTDSFDYRLSDGDGPTDTATVTVTVTDGPSGPMPVFDQPGAVAFNGTPGSVIELPHAAVYEVPAGTVSFAFTAADTSGA